jgi:hypothetical protein
LPPIDPNDPEEEVRPDKDVLPTLLAYKNGELQKTWIRVDWEVGEGGVEALLRRFVLLDSQLSTLLTIVMGSCQETRDLGEADQTKRTTERRGIDAARTVRYIVDDDTSRCTSLYVERLTVRVPNASSLPDLMQSGSYRITDSLCRTLLREAEHVVPESSALQPLDFKGVGGGGNLITLRHAHWPST